MKKHAVLLLVSALLLSALVTLPGCSGPGTPEAPDAPDGPAAATHGPEAQDQDQTKTQGEQEQDQTEQEQNQDERNKAPMKDFSTQTSEPARSTSPSDPSGFVEVAEMVPDVILEIRYYSTYNFTGVRVIGYEEPVALLTREAAEALKAVSDDMKEKGYRLKIYDAYRPRSAVEHFRAWLADEEDTAMKPYFYPETSKSELSAQGYISTRSGHSRGSTLDLTLVDMATGKEVDMGGPFDYFGELSHAAYTAGLTEAQIANRRTLKEAMEAHGFKGIRSEWWHFYLAGEPYPDTYFEFPVRKLSR